jgi:hypothetical protein
VQGWFAAAQPTGPQTLPLQFPEQHWEPTKHCIPSMPQPAVAHALS